jgi:hypothetical protein
MAEKQQQKKHNYEVNTVLDRIMAQNPQIIPSRIELFTEVYYPIAILEMEVSETTFEDFDLVPLTVLRFVDAGLGSAKEIADMMGLSPNYTQKILDLLMGYSFVDSNGITELGRESLGMKQKIEHANVRQRFQADAITGDLLKIGEQPSEADLQGKDKTFIVIPHMPHIEGVSIDEINNQLLNADFTKYKQYKGDILNANVDEIKNVECVGLQYIKAYLVKMQGIDSPFIISYQYDSSQNSFKDRFRWLPMKMPSEKAYGEYGFSRDIACYSERALQTINELYRLVCKKITEIDEDKLKKLLGHIQPFDYSTMDISMGRIMDGVPEQISVYVNADSFTKWNAFVLRFLENYDDVGGYLFTDSWLNGLFIRFESQNPDIRKASKEYKKMLRHEDKKQLVAYLRNELFDKGQDGKAIDFNKFIETLNQYMVESKED